MIRIAEARKWNGGFATVTRDDGEVRIGEITYIPKNGETPSSLKIKVPGSRGRPPTWPLSAIASVEEADAESAPAAKETPRAPSRKVRGSTPTDIPAPVVAVADLYCPITGELLDIRKGGNAAVIQTPDGQRYAFHYQEIVKEWLDDLLVVAAEQEQAAVPPKPQRVARGTKPVKAASAQTGRGKKTTRVATGKPAAAPKRRTRKAS